MDSGDWRTLLTPDSRQRILNRIMQTLARHLPVSGREGVEELKKTAARFEEKIYTAATSQQDYLRKISLKMLTMETKSQNHVTNPLHPNAASSGPNAHSPGATSYETISGPEVSGEEEDDGDVSKEDGLEEVAVTEEQNSAVGHKENVRVGENEGVQGGKELIKIEMGIHNGECTAPAVAVAGAPAGAPLDSTSQMGNVNGADWQEETYQKIKSMREMHLSRLNDLYRKIVSTVQKHDSLPRVPQYEQIEKLKTFKSTLERIVLFLQLNKHDIQLTHKEKLFMVESHISFFLSSKRPHEPSSSLLQGKLTQSSMQLQQPQSLGGQTNPPMQPVHGSMAAMQQNSFTNMQCLSLSGVNTVQPGYGVAIGILPQIPVNYCPQQVNISSLSSQSGTNPVQANLGSLHPQISRGLNSDAKLDERLVQVEEQLEKIEAHSEKVETLLVDINEKLSYLVKMQDAKVSRDIKRPAKYMSSSWTGNSQSKRKHRVADMIRQSCKHRRLGRGDKAVVHPVASHDDCVENDQRKLEAEEPTS